VSAMAARTLRRLPRRIAWHLVAILLAVVMVGPFLWMISSSLKTGGQIFQFPPRLFPSPAQWANFGAIFTQAPMVRYLVNSILITGLSIIGQLCCCSLAGYAFARMRFVGRRLLFLALMLALIVPPQVIIIPQFLLARVLGWLDTYWPLVLPYFLAGAIGSFLFRQFFLSVPVDFEEAARLDGARQWQVFAHIYLPLSGPVAATVAIFTLVAQWNNLIYPVIYLNTRDLLPVTVGLTGFIGEFSANWQLLMSASVVSILPVILVYAFAQRYFVEGMVSSGLK
jgi:multiple sugar transport system permease protein